MSKTGTYRIPEKEYSATLFQIKSDYKVEAETVSTEEYNIWDTFDWQIVRSGYLLTQIEDRFTLSDESNPVYFERLEKNHAVLFASSFKGNELQQLIGKLIKNRAVEYRKKVKIDTHSFKVLNSDSKIILNLFVEEYHHEESEDLRYFVLRPLRGYESETKEFGKYLESIGCSNDKHPFQEKVLGCSIDELYSSKTVLHLNPKSDSQAESRYVIKKLIELAEVNVEGVKNDRDIEFLHDFRVYTRRLRSYISQVKNVFPQQIVNEMKKDFASIGTATGPTRDLDVYLQQKENFIKLLPRDMQPGLIRFFELLEKNRDLEFNKLKNYLDSEALSNIFKKWTKFAEDNERFHEENSTRPIIETASTFIQKVYRKITKKIQLLHEHSDEEVLHDLRIDCKKLRYLLEIFSTLYTDKRIPKLIKELKSFQDYLGLLNDLAVQQQTLKSYLGKLQNNHDSLLIASSVGGLVVKLHERQAELTKKYLSELKNFERPESVKAYKDIFKPQEAL